jgi:hypothetical protein
MTLLRLALVALAALRATRFITSDKLGEWWFVGRAKFWAFRHEAPAGSLRVERYSAGDDAMPTPPASWGWRSKLVSGLDCPFCVGFWVVAAALLAEVATRRTRPLRALWTFIAGVAAMNYVTGHVSSRLDG